jgi:hypothetical protein
MRLDFKATKFSFDIIMSRWKDNLKSTDLLHNIRTATKLLEDTATSNFTVASMAEYSRAIKVLKLLEARISTLDPELFSQNTWANFLPLLSNARAQAEAVSRNPNSGQLLHLHFF